MNNNLVEFVVRMRDMMSGGLSRLSATSQSSFSAMSRHSQLYNQRNQVLSMSFSELQRKIQQTESTIKGSTIPSQIAFARRELQQLQQQASRHMGNISGGGGSSVGSSGGSSGGFGLGNFAMGSMLGNFATQGVNKLMDVATDGVAGIISKSMEKEMAIIGLKTFLGEKGANEAYKNIRHDADVTPFDTPSLLMVNRSLISAGASAKDARKDTMNLANAVAAVGGGNDILARMAVNMQQIKTLGKASGLDIKQFGFAGINIYEMLAKSTGKNIAQVKEMDVTYDQLSKALEMAGQKGGIYAGALEAMSKTRSGKWSTVKDKFGSAMADIGDAFAPVMNRVLDMAVKIADRIGPMLERAKPYIDYISNGIGQVIDFVRELTSGTGEWSDYVKIIADYYRYAFVILGEIFAKVYKIVSQFTEWVKKSELVKDIFKGMAWLLKRIWDIIGAIFDVFLWYWEKYVKPALDRVELFYRMIKGKHEMKVTTVVKGPVKPKDLSLIEETKALSASNAAAGSAAGDTVTGGGPKVVNITVGKFFDNIQFNTTNLKESSDEIEKVVLEALARVLYQGAKTVN